MSAGLKYLALVVARRAVMGAHRAAKVFFWSASPRWREDTTRARVQPDRHQQGRWIPPWHDRALTVVDASLPRGERHDRPSTVVPQRTAVDLLVSVKSLQPHSCVLPTPSRSGPNDLCLSLLAPRVTQAHPSGTRALPRARAPRPRNRAARSRARALHARVRTPSHPRRRRQGLARPHQGRRGAQLGRSDKNSPDFLDHAASVPTLAARFIQYRRPAGLPGAEGWTRGGRSPADSCSGCGGQTPTPEAPDR